MNIKITEAQYNKLMEGLGMSLVHNPKPMDEHNYDFYSSEEGFSKRLKHKAKMDRIKKSSDNIENYRKPSHGALQISPNAEKSYKEPYSPIRPDDLPLDKYLELKKKNNSEK
jgi:hypothetical protein